MGKAWKDVDGIWKGRWQWGTGKGLLLGGISTLALEGEERGGGYVESRVWVGEMRQAGI